MGRVAITFNPKELQQQIKVVEANGQLANMSALSTLIVDTAWAKGLNNGKGVSTAWVVQQLAKGSYKIAEFSGKREVREFSAEARAKAQASIAAKREAPKAPKTKASETVTASWLQHMLDAWVFKGKKGLVQRAAKGSRSAAMKAMCIQCCSADKTAIRTCSSYSCPLWGFRPYQKNDEETETDDVEVVQIS